jgi:hypothetical protein
MKISYPSFYVDCVLEVTHWLHIIEVWKFMAFHVGIVLVKIIAGPVFLLIPKLFPASHSVNL